MKQNNTNKVLIIEDDTFVGELYREILAKEGFEVDIAYDGQDALLSMLKEYYDLVLVDIMLPKLDGVTAVKKLNKLGIKQGYIAFLSNLGHRAVIKECFNLGADTYLIKSALTPDEALTEIKKLLREGEVKRRDSMGIGKTLPSPEVYKKYHSEVSEVDSTKLPFAEKLISLWREGEDQLKKLSRGIRVDDLE